MTDVTDAMLAAMDQSYPEWAKCVRALIANLDELNDEVQELHEAQEGAGDDYARACELVDRYTAQSLAWQQAHHYLARAIVDGVLAKQVADGVAAWRQPPDVIKVEPPPAKTVGKLALQEAFADSGIYGVSLNKATEIMGKLGIKVDG